MTLSRLTTGCVVPNKAAVFKLDEVQTIFVSFEQILLMELK